MNNHHHPEKEQIENENSFLKMKLALETGMHLNVHKSGNKSLSPDLENVFLKNIIAFEEQFEARKTIRLYDKIGRPTQFLPVQQIPNNEIVDRYTALLDYLLQHGVDFSVCSPNITVKELYRFITEELFWEEVDDITIPGMTCGFIYDEFHPDPVYDNTRLIKEDLLPDIFRKGELFFHYLYGSLSIFNDEPLPPAVFQSRIQRFKTLCIDLELLECRISACTVEDTHCTVRGFYHARAVIPPATFDYEGAFEAGLKQDDYRYWNLIRLSLENFNP